MQSLKSHKDFQKSHHHSQDVEVQDCSHKLHRIFSQFEVWQEQPQAIGLQFKIHYKYLSKHDEYIQRGTCLTYKADKTYRLFSSRQNNLKITWFQHPHQPPCYLCNRISLKHRKTVEGLGGTTPVYNFVSCRRSTINFIFLCIFYSL